MKLETAYEIAKKNLEIDRVRKEVSQLLDKMTEDYGITFQFPINSGDERCFSDDFPFLFPLNGEQRNEIGYYCIPQLFSWDVCLSTQEEINAFFKKLNRSTVDIEAYKIWATEAPLYVENSYYPNLWFLLGVISGKNIFIKIVDMGAEIEQEAD
jgi:hypothetical protein